jgi:hypothetical protein
MTEPIPISRDDLRHLFDLAVDTPLVCSGSFDTEDVALLRRIAVALGTDPNTITPTEFANQYPHPYKRRGVYERRLTVGGWGGADGVMYDDSGPGRRWISRVETPAERDARVAEEKAADGCVVGMYSRPCGKPATDPIHISETASA